MSETNSNKRKSDEVNIDLEKRKRSEVSDIEKSDIKTLKESIRSEVLASIAPTISSLENEMKYLKQQVVDLKQKVLHTHVDTDVEEDHNQGSRVPKTLNPLSSSNSPTSQSSNSQKVNSSSINKNLDISTPINSFTDKGTLSKSPLVFNNSRDTPKHVFGATTTLGSTFSFNAKNSNIFDNEKSKSVESYKKDEESHSKTGSAPAVTSTFGSNTKFTNAFENILEKKSFLDDTNGKFEEKVPFPEKEKSGEQYKQIDLSPIKSFKTGEEDEISLFSANAKLFELDLTNISEGWKERGSGALHLNQSKNDSQQIRLVMRSRAVLRVILNTKITHETTVLKGYSASLSPGKFLRLNFIKEGKPHQVMLKVSNEEIRDELFAKIEELKKTIDPVPLGVANK